MANVNDSFFNGFYKDVWRAIIPEQLTTKEVKFMIEHFHLQPGDEVLDMMCGYGRHSVELALNGIKSVAVDNLPEYIAEIEDQALKRGLSVTAVKQNVLDYKADRKFKLVICMGNSLNFFDADDTRRLLSNWADALDSGSHLLINSWSLAEIAIPHFAEKSEAPLAGLNIVSRSRYLFYPTRIETQTEMISAKGEVESKLAIDYIYSVNEMDVMLKSCGFNLKEIYTIPGKKLFSVGDPRAYIIAQRR